MDLKDGALASTSLLWHHLVTRGSEVPQKAGCARRKQG